jgi:hypothetical protein
MKMFLRHLALCALPLVGGIGAGYGFAAKQGSCGALVGPIFAAKCHGRQLEYQLKFQLAGTAFGTLIAASVGAWLEHRRRRAVQGTPSPGEPS